MKTHVLAVAFSLSDLLKFHERQADDGSDGDNGDDGDDGKEGVVLGDAPLAHSTVEKTQPANAERSFCEGIK